MRAFINTSRQTPNYRPLTTSGEINAEYWMTEQVIQSDEESYDILHELMLAQYIFEQDGLPEVLYEGFSDFLSSAAEFFKNMIRKVIEFFRQVYAYMSSYFVAFDKFIEKNKDRLTSAGKITVQGYKYTLDKDVPNLDPINNIVSEFNKEISKIEEMNINELRNRIDEFRNNDGMSKVRASILNTTSPISSEDFDDAVFSLFRDGEKEKTTIEYTGAGIAGIISDYKDLKKTFKKVRKDQSEIEKLLGSLKSFFEKGYNSRYESGTRKHIARTLTKDEKGTKFTSSDDGIEYEDKTNILQILNLYYSFRFTQSKEVSNVIIKVATMKTNAYKEAIKFYETVMRKAVFGGDKSDTD